MKCPQTTDDPLVFGKKTDKGVSYGMNSPDLSIWNFFACRFDNRCWGLAIRKLFLGACDSENDFLTFVAITIDFVSYENIYSAFVSNEKKHLVLVAVTMIFVFNVLKMFLCRFSLWKLVWTHDIRIPYNKTVS